MMIAEEPRVHHEVEIDGNLKNCFVFADILLALVLNFSKKP
jgi:hypothetical protein